MHHWFLERWPTPEEWLRARSAYTRSTAVASMVGHVIGLGDLVEGQDVVINQEVLILFLGDRDGYRGV